MKNALISKIEPRIDENENSGYRVSDISETPFPVAEDYFWVECEDFIKQDEFVYVNNKFSPIKVEVSSKKDNNTTLPEINNFQEF